MPYSQHQDTVGPLARTVHDAATMLSDLAGSDEFDTYPRALPNGGVLPDAVRAATGCRTLRGVRIGVPRNGITPSVLWAPVNETYLLSEFDKAIEVLKKLGAEIIDSANFSDEVLATYLAMPSNDGGPIPVTLNNESITAGADFASDIASYFSELTVNPNRLHSVTDLRDFTVKDPREDYPDRDVSVWNACISLGFNASDERAFEAVQSDLGVDERGGVTGVINQLNLSALIIPTEYAPTWAASPGLPAVTVPLGVYPDGTPVMKGKRELIAVAPGIPFGLTFLGKRWSEETLISLGYAFEQATHHRDRIVPGPNAVIPRTEIEDVL